MTTLAGYQLHTKLYAGANSVVYQATRAEAPSNVVLKILTEAYQRPAQVAWFKREYDLLGQLDLNGVVKAYDLTYIDQQWVMVLEDFEGQSLAQLGVAGQLTMAEFLRLATQLVRIVGDLHQAHVIHKDINPSNIVLNPATGQVKLIDFGISTTLARENTTFRNPTTLQGTLAYLSPEQTGRMNRALDYRTDFYALGVTFYELLTGQLPFTSADPLELVHAHLAQQAVPPHSLNPAVPPILSDIVLKLMSKDPTARYLSAHGLQADLEQCLGQIDQLSQLTFPLGQQDQADQLDIPQQLYGREAETGQLHQALERVLTNAQTELLLVAGYAGIGKTALVQELYQPLTAQRGYFIQGKFDQLQRDMPYLPFIQAFEGLVRQLLTESEAQLTAWRAELDQALGDNGQVVVDVIPDLALIIGPQPPVPNLNGAEAQYRFNFVFQNFVRVFSQPEHPLVLFLDDLQWADGASLKLMEQLTRPAESQALLLIGAYRDHEVSASHPLQLTVEAIQQEGGAVETLTLNPLAQTDLTQFVADTVRQPIAEVESLAELLLAKTGGNPFYLIQFLYALVDEDLLTYQAPRWQWDVASIQQRQLTDNVVDLLARKVQQLPPASQHLLKIAATLGNQFDLHTIAHVAEQSPAEAGQTLWPSLREGLIFPLSETYQLATSTVDLNQIDQAIRYRFGHDRIQQAVYSLLSETERHSLHQQIGDLLLRQISETARAEHIFEIVNHLNQGQPYSSRQLELAQLNLQAGQRAKQAAAYQSALTYLQQTLTLLPPDSWQANYTLTYTATLNAAESALLSGDFTAMDSYLTLISQRAQGVVDQTSGYELRIQAQHAQNKLVESVEVAIQALALLEVVLPEQPELNDFLGILGETQTLLAEREISALAELPLMTDPTKLTAMRIMASVGSAAFGTNPLLFPILICKQINILLRYGNTTGSSYVYTTYGFIISGMGQIDEGYAFGQLALKLLDKLDDRQGKAQTVVFYSFTAHLKRTLKDTGQLLLDTYQTGLAVGDLQHAAMCLQVNGILLAKTLKMLQNA